MSEETWKDRLPEELQSAPYFKNAESPEQVLADLNNAAAWQGNSIRIPGPDAGAEDIAAFQSKAIEKFPGLMPTPNLEDSDAMSQVFGQLGRPESPDGYSLPEGLEMDVATLRAHAHQSNMTNQQFQALVSALGKEQADAIEASQNALAEQYQTLQTEWGAAYEQNMQEVGKLLSDAPDVIKEAFANKTLTADQLRWFHSKAQLGESDAQIPGQGDGAPRQMTPDEAQAQLVEVEKRLFAKDVTPEEQQMLQQKRLKLIALSMGQSELPPMRVVEG